MRATIRSFEEEVDKKIASSESNLNDKIYKIGEAQRDSSDALYDANNHLSNEEKTTSRKGTKNVEIVVSARKSALSYVTPISAAKAKTVEETIL